MHFGDCDGDAFKLGRTISIVMMHFDGDALKLGRKKCILVMAMMMHSNWEELSALW